MSFKFLACAVSEQCQEIKQGLASFPYFETWDKEAVAECCRVSSVAEYSPDQIILGPGCGSSHTVYFLLEGVCKMIRTLHVEMNARKIPGKPYKFADSKISGSDLFKNEGYSSSLLNRIRTERKPANETGWNIQARPDNDASSGRLDGTESERKDEVGEEVEQESGFGQQQESDSDQTCQVSNAKKEFEPEHHLKVLEECRKRREEASKGCKKGATPEKAKNVESFFVQTCLLFKGACFGIEKLEGDNFIISTTKVKCLKIPERFLFKHNPRYIWNRIRLFHSLRLPKDEDVLHRVKSERLWIREKEKLSLHIVTSKGAPNYTTTSDVPYSLRLCHVG